MPGIYCGQLQQQCWVDELHRISLMCKHEVTMITTSVAPLKKVWILQFSMNKTFYTTQSRIVSHWSRLCFSLHCSYCFQLTVTPNTGNQFLLKVTWTLQERWYDRIWNKNPKYIQENGCNNKAINSFKILPATQNKTNCVTCCLHKVSDLNKSIQS